MTDHDDIALLMRHPLVVIALLQTPLEVSAPDLMRWATDLRSGAASPDDVATRINVVLLKHIRAVIDQLNDEAATLN